MDVILEKLLKKSTPSKKKVRSSVKLPAITKSSTATQARAEMLKYRKAIVDNGEKLPKKKPTWAWWLGSQKSWNDYARHGGAGVGNLYHKRGQRKGRTLPTDPHELEALQTTIMKVVRSYRTKYKISRNIDDADLFTHAMEAWLEGLGTDKGLGLQTGMKRAIRAERDTLVKGVAAHEVVHLSPDTVNALPDIGLRGHRLVSESRASEITSQVLGYAFEAPTHYKRYTTGRDAYLKNSRMGTTHVNLKKKAVTVNKEGRRALKTLEKSGGSKTMVKRLRSALDTLSRFDLSWRKRLRKSKNNKELHALAKQTRTRLRSIEKMTKQVGSLKEGAMNIFPAVRIHEMTTCAMVAPAGAPVAPMGATKAKKRKRGEPGIMIGKQQDIGKPMRKLPSFGIWANNPPANYKEDEYDAAINIPLLD